MYAGGGYVGERRLAREIRRNVPADEVPAYIQSLLDCYLQHRHGAHETFAGFTQRYSGEQFAQLLEQHSVQAA